MQRGFWLIHLYKFNKSKSRLFCSGPNTSAFCMWGVMWEEHESKWGVGGFPGGPVAKNPLPMQGTWVWSLVGELTAHMPQRTTSRVPADSNKDQHSPKHGIKAKELIYLLTYGREKMNWEGRWWGVASRFQIYFNAHPSLTSVRLSLLP